MDKPAPRARDSFGRHEHRVVIVGGYNNDASEPDRPADDVLSVIDSALFAHHAGNREDFDAALIVQAREEIVRLRAAIPRRLRSAIANAEAEVVARWLKRLAAEGIVTIGGKGGALEAVEEARRA